MITHRNRSTPSGNGTHISTNTEAVRDDASRTREWPMRTNVIAFGERPIESQRRFQSQRRGQLSGDAWGSSRPLLGDQRSESNRVRLSASKGTRETQPSMAITRIGRRSLTVESSPMRRLGVGSLIVVGGRESRPHGEGVKDDSCWMTEGFNNRKGFR